MTAKILIVDDDPLMRKTLSNLLRREGYGTAEAGGGEEAIRHLDGEIFDLVITDLHMEPMSGLELLKAIKPGRPDLEVIVVTAYGTIDVAVEAMKLGAFDFVTKPFQPEEILLRARNALEKSRLKDEVRRLQTEARSAFGIHGIVGGSEPLRKVLSILPRVAQTESTMLITGESGTGKELIARAIAAASRRAQGPFVSISCAALPEQLLESELFGHVKGAFTTAFAARKGLIEEAGGGTFFLDEIGEATLPIQAKLLRVLEERMIRRIGENRTLPVDVRFVAATNQNLEDLIPSGRFRQDLYYRLNVVRLHLPPLRERVDDIPLLMAHFLEKYNLKMNKRVAGVTPEARAMMMAYPWPGNVRELANFMERMIAISSGDTLDIPDLPEEIRGTGAADRETAAGLKPSTQATMHQIEKRSILEALAAHDGNVTHSARALKISRATLQNKMRKFGIRARGA